MAYTKDTSIKHLIVTENNAKPAMFLGLTYFDAGMMKDFFAKADKRLDFENKTVDERLEYFIELCKDKYVMYIDSKLFNKLQTYQTNEAITIEYLKSKDQILSTNPKVVPLYQFFRTYLRQLVIKHYYKNQILPMVSKEMIEYCDQMGGVSNIRWGYGFISGFKKKILGEYVGKELYWIRFIYSPLAESIIKENLGDTRALAKNRELKVFYPNNYNRRDSFGGVNREVQFIDIFTTDSTTGDFLMLTADKKILGFAADLTPLIKNLSELDLINAWE